MVGPFQALQLTDAEQQNCHDRVFQLLDRTLRSYDERDGQTQDGRSSAPLHHSNLDNTRWKLLKTKADASLYTQRGTCTLQDQNLLGGDWQNPVTTLMTGTIRGDLDEQPVECAVLAELMGPIDVDPFRFLGITWMIYEHTWPIKAMVKPRDFVTLTATGTMTRANGDRIGYEVVQPARLAQCPPLPGSIIRGKIMYAVIFKQQEPGLVDVFVNTYVETQGVVLDKMIVSVTWKGNLGFWGAVKLAEMKKLQWCIDNCRSERQKEQQRLSASAVGVCTGCYERRSMMKRGNGVVLDDKDCCVLCSSPTCYRCRVERMLKVVDTKSSKLKDQLVLVCQPCLMFIQKIRPTDLAMLNHKRRIRSQRAMR